MKTPAQRERELTERTYNEPAPHVHARDVLYTIHCESFRIARLFALGDYVGDLATRSPHPDALYHFRALPPYRTPAALELRARVARVMRAKRGTLAEWSTLWDAMDAFPQDWIATTREMYWAMLEAVPPRAMGRFGAFLVGEARRHNESGQGVYAAFYLANGYDDIRARHMTVSEFRGKFGEAFSGSRA